MISHYATDAQFRLIDNEAVFTSAEFAANVRAAMPALKSVEGGFSSIDVYVLRRDIALADTPLTWVFTDTTGGVMRLRGTMIWVWEHRPEGWRVAHAHSASFPDTATTP